jgi:hypothetical protein
MAKQDKTMTWIGLAALAAGIYYLYKRSTPAAQTATVAAPRTVAAPSVALDPCGTARKLLSVGRTHEAAYWVNLCAQQGGTV